MIPIIAGGALLLGSALLAMRRSSGGGAWVPGPAYSGLDTGAGRGPAELAYGAKLSPAARRAFREAGEYLRINPSCLTTNAFMESAFRPDAYNSKGDAIGIIQWTKTGRRAAGATAEELRGMGLVEQIRGPMVAYFDTVRARFGLPLWPSMVEVRAACGWPASIGKGLDFVLFDRTRPRVFSANARADKNGDGAVTKGEWFFPSIAAYNRGLSPKFAAL